MRYSLVPLVATTICTLASATVQIPSGTTHKDNWGNAIVENQCSFEIYYILDNNQGRDTIAPGSNIEVPVYEKDADHGGMSIKLFKDPDTDIWSVPAVTQFELTATTMLFYDISNVNSDIGTGKNGNGEDCDKEPPFMNDGMKMTATDGKSATCEAGENPCKNAYSLYNDDFATAATDLGNDVTLTICPGGRSSGRGSGNDADSEPAKNMDASSNEPTPSSEPSASSPTPTPTPPADKPTTEEKDAVVPDDKADDAEASTVYVTHTVTGEAVEQTQYVKARGVEKEKRQEHIHQHVHNKIHKRRHEA